MLAAALLAACAGSDTDSLKPGATQAEVQAQVGNARAIFPGRRIWSWNFRNAQCQWFRVPIGADGRALGPGAQALLPACLHAGGS